MPLEGLRLVEAALQQYLQWLEYLEGKWVVNLTEHTTIRFDRDQAQAALEVIRQGIQAEDSQPDVTILPQPE